MPRARAVLYRGTAMGIALDAEACQQDDLFRRRLGEDVRGVAVDGEDGGAHGMNGHRKSDL